MVVSLFEKLGESGSKFIGFLKSILESAMSIIWTPAAEGGTGGTFTDVGILIVTAMAVGIVFSVIRYVVRLVHLRG